MLSSCASGARVAAARSVHARPGRRGRSVRSWALVWLALWAGDASAQTASLTGRVTDAGGEGLAGVVVTVAAPVLTEPSTAVSDGTGAYAVAGLPGGDYAVTFALRGFAEVREAVTLAPGEPGTLAATLRLIRFTETVDVVAVAPGPGARLDRDRVAAVVSILDADRLSQARSSLSTSLYGRLGSVTLEGTTTNDWQPTLRFRGFTASPLLGLPQGIAVYQNGVRVNEPFGDTVQFDLLPQFAVARAQLTAGADPTSGLNALGGVLALRLKNGFDDEGFGGEVAGGSFGRVGGTAEVGVSRGPWALYAGGSRADEDGWRAWSPSEVTQAVVDGAYRAGRVDAGVSVTHADTRLNGNGPAPVELLEADRSAVFTYPDITENGLTLLQGRLALATSSAWSIQATGYYRDLDRRTLNGDEADFDACVDGLLPPGAPGDTLCAFENEDDDGGAASGTPLVDAVTGRFITGADAAGDGAFNRTRTGARGYGATVQATSTAPVGRHENLLVVGVSVDLSDVAFASSTEIGSRTADRTVVGSGLFAGLFGHAPDDRFNTDLQADGRAFGAYLSDTFSLTDRAHLTVSGRVNHVRLTLADQLGTSLDGRHAFSRVNPGVGLAYQATEAATLFGRYAESSRAPTAAEVSCADPAEPCRVPNAFVSDPPLEQVVARSVEGGARGRWAGAGASLAWSASVFLTRSRDDILFVASPELIGTGYFQNAGDTQRTGVDVDVSGRVAGTDWFVSYGLVNATFQSVLALPGSEEANDAATDGSIAVEPGDRLPGIPRHSVKAGLRQSLTSRWGVGVEVLGASSRVLVGDEGNDQAELGGHAVVQVRSTYGLDRGVELFLQIDNVFDTRYETFGALAEIDIDLTEAPGASDPRFLAPGAPRSVLAGVRVRF
jgi:outer membrane receptor protein involved in Fe transport